MTKLIVLESNIINDNTGTIVTIINSDSSVSTIVNSKVSGLVNLGTNVFSAYPLVPGIDVQHDFLKNLQDVSIVSPTNNQVLTYNSSTGKWVPGASTGTGIIQSVLQQSVPANTATTVLTYTPSVSTNLIARVSVSLSPASVSGLLSQLNLNWTDPQAGNQTFLWAGFSGLAINPGNTYIFPTVFFSAAGTSGLSITTTSTSPIYVSTDLAQG
jgi:hypothetical protein